MLKKKNVSFEDRLDKAHTAAAKAVSVVETIALDLEIAVADKQALVQEIDVETTRLYNAIDTLTDLRYEALVAIDTNTVKADNIRALVSA